MQKTIETARLVLRPLTLTDAPKIATLITYDVVRWLTRLPWPYTLANAHDWIGSLKWETGGYVWAICQDDQIIGFIGLDPELGYWLGPDHWGHGFASEAAQAVLQSYFDNPSAPPLHTRYFLGNHRSANVLVKLGFSPNGKTHSHSAAPNKMVPSQKMLLTPEHWHALNPIQLITDRLILSPITPDDFDALYDMLHRKEVAWQLGRWPHPLNPGLLRKRILKMRWRGGWGATLKITNETNNTIGMIGFNSPSGGECDDITIGYALHPDHWGHGYMTEALITLTAYLFRRYRVSQLFASAVVDNTASQHVLQKAGFQEYDRIPFIQSSRGYEVTSIEYKLLRPSPSSF